MSTVDEILATGQYTDRRGRSWRPNLGDNWVHFRGRKPRGELFYDVLTDPEMRLLIERDLHRDVCPGLSACNGHPVPSVITPFAWGSRDFEVYAAWANTTGTFEQSLPEAMDAARALAVGE